MSGRIAVSSLTAIVVAVGIAGCGGTESPETTEGQVLTVALASEPVSLEPGRAADLTSANVAFNLMDPLVKLDEEREAAPNLAQGWETSADGKTVTFQLRRDGRWTNDDPVTAHDFEWSWKRMLSPDPGMDFAYQLYGIEGAQAYNSCDPKETSCEVLRNQVGVRAIDDYALQVKLTSPQPWFVQQVAHQAFLAVHRPTVERFGEAWTDPRNIVTNGPFTLTSWKHDDSITLTRNETWRDAESVSLERVELQINPDALGRIAAFDRGEIQAASLETESPVPSSELDRLRQRAELAVYPAPGTNYFGFNVRNVPDVNQRRAMAFALDRTELVALFSPTDIPATSLTPPGIPGYDTITPAFLEAGADLSRARGFMEKARKPKLEIVLMSNDFPGHERILASAKEAWRALGIETKVELREWAQFLEALGPPPSEAMDVYHLGWIYDYADAFSFLETLTCDNASNFTGACDPDFDQLLEQARRTQDPLARYDLYADAEARMAGSSGRLPIVPFRWFTWAFLEVESVAESFNVNPLGYFDLARVVLAKEGG